MDIKDRRQHIRWQVNKEVKAQLKEGLSGVACLLQDLNFDGARVSLKQNLARDRHVYMKLILTEGAELELKVWVVWQKKVAGKNVYGLYFGRLKDKDKEVIYNFLRQNVPDFLNGQSHGMPQTTEKDGGEEEMKENSVDLSKDRRIFERIPATLPVKLMNLTRNHEVLADTLDVSAKGLGVISREPLQEGDNLEVWLNMPDRKDPFYTRGSVVWAQPQSSGGHRAGICLERAEFMGLSRIFNA